MSKLQEMATKKRVGVVAGVAGSIALAATAFFLSGPTDIQPLINAAQPGDVITLEAGGSYYCPGGCILPNKPGAEFITIKSSRYDDIPVRAMDSKTPSAETVALMANVTSSFSTEPVFRADPGAHHYKLLGLNLQPPAGQGTRIVELGISGAAQDTLEEMPHDFVIDKSWLHAAPDQEMQRCLALNSSNTDVTNSWLTDCHGRGYDAQAIGGWNGGGNYKIINNSLNGSGEIVMLGGSPATIPGLIPTNVEVRRNYFWRPLSWHERDPSFVPVPPSPGFTSNHWTVKNLFELKNARNVVVDGNIFDGNWTDAQAGRAIQFTPRPSDSGAWAVVEDVQFTNNIIRNTGAGANVLGADESNGGTVSTDTRLRRVRIANSLWEIDGAKFGSDGVFLVVTNKTDEVTVENNTVSHTGNVISTDYAPNSRFKYQNNISRHNNYGIFGSGSGVGNPSIAQYFPGSTIAGNVIAKEVGGPSNAESLYPAGNYFPETVNAIGLGSDCRLSASSPYKGKGTDGKDPGCNIDALNAALGGSGSIPLPSVSPTVTITPSVNPQPSPSAQPTKTPSADGTKGPTIVDSNLATWTLSPQPEGKTLRDGTQVGGGQGREYKYLSGAVHVSGLDGNWYLWTGSSWIWLSATEPGGATPSPTAPRPSPTATPTPTVTPTPAPSPTVNPRPSPLPLPTCSPNQVIGDPVKCLCVTGVKNNCRCR